MNEVKIISNSKDQLQTINFESKQNAEVLPYMAILPTDYFKTEKKYPVFYLLHGLFGSYENWTQLTHLTDYAKTKDLIIICPEGKNSWYTDNENLHNQRFESYILDELIPDVEERFRVKKDQRSRAIGGLSMGGYGAFKFAFRRPELFCAAVSMSGAFDIQAFIENENDEWSELHPYAKNAFQNQTQTQLANEDIFYLAENFPGDKIAELPFLYVYCGVEDSLLEVNRKFSQLLQKKKFKHQYAEFSGGHDWNYWDRQVKLVLNVVVSNFE